MALSAPNDPTSINHLVERENIIKFAMAEETGAK